MPQGNAVCLGAFGKMSGSDCRRFLCRLTPSPYSLFFRNFSQFSSSSRAFGKGKETAATQAKMIQDNDLYVTLPSNASANLFPSNSKSHYRVALPRQIQKKKKKIGKLGFIVSYIHYRSLTFPVNAYVPTSCSVTRMI